MASPRRREVRIPFGRVHRDARMLIRQALSEDVGRGDLTSRLLLSNHSRILARVIAKQGGVVAGTQPARWVFETFDGRVRCSVRRRDGQPVHPGQVIMTVSGPARSILAAERTALNFLGHLSGIATLTRRYVQRAQPHRARIFDTRKTLPGLRVFEKHAVRSGGGDNHRMGLAEAVLIKTNHLRVLRSATRQRRSVTTTRLIHEAVARARRARAKPFVEIEVTTLREFKAALAAAPDAILLDNWPLERIRTTVALRRCATTAPLLEVSGGVTLENVRAIAATGVDRISVGRLTHSAPSLDVSLEVG